VIYALLSLSDDIATVQSAMLAAQAVHGRRALGSAYSSVRERDLFRASLPVHFWLSRSRSDPTCCPTTADLPSRMWPSGDLGRLLFVHRLLRQVVDKAMARGESLAQMLGECLVRTLRRAQGLVVSNARGVR
jgi:hypothetical protein